MSTAAKLTPHNYGWCVFKFRERQAGVTEIYDPGAECYHYNSYCLEQKLLKEIYTREFAFLDDALEHSNREFGNWEFQDLSLKKPACGSCANH